MTPITVSDHALVRFLDRIADVDVEAIRAAIAASLDRAHCAAAKVASADYTVRIDGVVFVVRGGVLVTLREAVKPSRSPARRPTR